MFSFLGAINKKCAHRAGKIELVGLRLGLDTCWFVACVVFNFVHMRSGDRYFYILAKRRNLFCKFVCFLSFMSGDKKKIVSSCASDHTLCLRLLV